jgi:hypothetical protein
MLLRRIVEEGSENSERQREMQRSSLRPEIGRAAYELAGHWSSPWPIVGRTSEKHVMTATDHDKGRKIANLAHGR